MEIPLTAKNIAVQKETLPVKERNFLYRTLRMLFRLSTKVYFRQLEVHNLQALKQEVPLILVSNHPSAFMDPILLASLVPQECIFLARGEAFNKKFGNIMMHKMNALPVYRDDISPDKIHLNRDTFKKSFRLLNHGKTLFFFPEGVSKTEPRLRPLKKGLARLVFNYAEENKWQKEVCLLPVGISYTDPHSFRSNAAIHFGEPVYITAWENKYKENAAKAINLLTDSCRKQLQNLSIFIEDETADVTVRRVESLSGFWEEKASSTKLEELNNFAGKYCQMLAAEPDEANRLKTEIESYFSKLKAHKIADGDLLSFIKKETTYRADLLKFITDAAFGFPLFLYGAINHILPYLLTGFLTKKMTPRADFTGSLRLAAGSFLTVIFYFLQICAAFLLSHSLWLTLLYAASLPLSGLFAIHYSEWILKAQKQVNLHQLRKINPNTFTGLVTMRAEVLGSIRQWAK